MPTVVLSDFAGVGDQLFDNNGNVLSGGKIYSYEAGTTTPLTTYTAVAGTVAHTNPIILDSAGRVPGGQIWLTVDQYKFVVTTSADVVLATYDNIGSASSGGITTEDIEDDAVTTAKIADDAVTTDKILNGNVTLVKLEDIGAGKVLGRVTAGDGPVEQLIIGTDILAPNGSGASLTSLPAAQLTGDVAKARMATNLNASGSAPFYVCRAWVNFNGTGTVAIRDSGNVASVTDNGTGNYTVSFITAMSSSDYVVVPGTGRNTDGEFRVATIFNKSTTGFQVKTWEFAGGSIVAIDVNDISLAVVI